MNMILLLLIVLFAHPASSYYFMRFTTTIEPWNQTKELPYLRRAYKGQFPWAVLLVLRGGPDLMGALVAVNWALAAAPANLFRRRRKFGEYFVRGSLGVIYVGIGSSDTELGEFHCYGKDHDIKEGTQCRQIVEVVPQDSRPDPVKCLVLFRAKQPFERTLIVSPSSIPDLPALPHNLREPAHAVWYSLVPMPQSEIEEYEKFRLRDDPIQRAVRQAEDVTETEVKTLPSPYNPRQRAQTSSTPQRPQSITTRRTTTSKPAYGVRQAEDVTETEVKTLPSAYNPRQLRKGTWRAQTTTTTTIKPAYGARPTPPHFYNWHLWYVASGVHNLSHCMPEATKTSLVCNEPWAEEERWLATEFEPTTRPQFGPQGSHAGGPGHCEPRAKFSAVLSCRGIFCGLLMPGEYAEEVLQQRGGPGDTRFSCDSHAHIGRRLWIWVSAEANWVTTAIPNCSYPVRFTPFQIQKDFFVP